MKIRRLLVTATAFAVVGVVAPASAQTTPPDEYMELALGIFSELIEINTTDSERGNNTLAAQALARHLLDAGFPEEDVHVLVPDDAPTKGNLVARYRGRDSSLKPILLLAHIDVVEALPEDWSEDLDPFAFTERDGYYYGRGVTDDQTRTTADAGQLADKIHSQTVQAGDPSPSTAQAFLQSC